MKPFKFIKSLRNSRGDTIVEVMVSLLVLSLVITSVYAIMNTSLHSGTEANQRTEALALAQSQVDLLVNAKNTDANFATNYQSATPFCITPTGSKDASANGNTDKLCDQYNASNYNVGVSYSSGVFTITAQWPAANAPAGVANLNLYYKLPGVYKKALETVGSAIVSGTNVQLNGYINSNGNSFTSCYFVYDTHSNFSSPTNAPGCVSSGCSDSPPPGTTTVCTNINGLTPGQQYYFQLCATNIVGSSCSPSSGTFTIPNTPVISGEQATNTNTVNGTTATINGLINPGGVTATCHFEWGTTLGYGNNVNCATPPGAGNSAVAESVNLTGLTAGRLYHFRLVGQNASGTGNGVDTTFTPVSTTPVINSFSASPTSVSYKDTTTLSWTSTNATSCSGTNFDTGGRTSGSATSNPVAGTTTFTVTCSNSGGSDQRSVTVTSGPSGLYGYYHQTSELAGPMMGTYLDPNVNFCSDGNGCENGWISLLGSRTGQGNVSCVSVQWIGQILMDSAGSYSFGTISDDGLQLNIDGWTNGDPWHAANAIINNWTQHSWTWNTGSRSWPAGWHNLMLEWQNNNGNGCYDNPYSADMILEWAPPGQGYSVVPQDHLRPY